jgi:hypothetical protein
MIFAGLAGPPALFDFGAAKKAAAKKAKTVKKPAKKVAKAKPVAAKITKASPTNAKALQKALNYLGRTVGDKTLIAVKADGAIGAKTVAATNRAFVNYIAKGKALVGVRAIATRLGFSHMLDTGMNGKLTLADVHSSAAVLSQLITAEATQRGGPKVSTAKPAAKKVVSSKKVVKTASGKTAIVQKVQTEEGAAVEATDPTTGKTAYAADEESAAEGATRPMREPAPVPPPPEAAPAAAAAAEAPEAAHAASAAEEGTTPTSTAIGPPVPAALAPESGEGESFLSRYKYPLIGVGALALIGAGIFVLKRRRKAAA